MAMQLTEAFVVPYAISSEWSRSRGSRHQRGREVKLPKDPRQWTKEHVVEWLRIVTFEHGLPEISPSKFAMNGKALCLMSSHMFLARVPVGGKLLYKDFQLRLCAALYSTKQT